MNSLQYSPPCEVRASVRAQHASSGQAGRGQLQRVARRANSSSRSMIPNARSGTNSTIAWLRTNAVISACTAGSSQYFATYAATAESMAAPRPYRIPRSDTARRNVAFGTAQCEVERVRSALRTWVSLRRAPRGTGRCRRCRRTARRRCADRADRSARSTAQPARSLRRTPQRCASCGR